MPDFLHDLRYGLRMITKAPVVAAVAALSLALGIAANSATFAVANGFLFAPFPYADQDELVMIWEIHPKSIDDEPVSPGNFLDYRDRTTVFEDLVAYDVVPANVTGGEEPERVRLVPMSPETFSLLGRSPLIGRDFETREGIAGEGRVVALSYPFWQRYFGEDRGVLGETLAVDGVPHAIVAVMPEDFDFLPANVDLFRPTSWQDRREDRERGLLVVGRLEPGRTSAEAQAELDGIAADLAREHPEENEGYRARAVGMRDYFPGRTDTWLMYILLTVSGFVLVIACANVANLLLARAEERQREVAVRTALGAGRVRILRQLLTESILLALAGGALGCVISIYVVRWTAGNMPAQLPRSFLPELDTTVLLYTLGISMLAGMIFGIAPALHTFTDDLREALGENSRGGTATRKRNRLRNAFVVAELAAALALLVGSGAMRNVFDEYLLPDPGVVVDGLLTAQLNVSEDRHPAEADLRRFTRDVLNRLEAMPGAKGVALMNQLPRSRGSSRTGFVVDGRPTPRYNEEPQTGWQAVNPGYFDTMGVPILDGRAFTPTDLEGSEPVAIANQSFVESFFREESPLGRTVTVLGKSRRIVGISRNVYQDRLPDDHGKIGALLYLPAEQQPARGLSFAVRVEGEPQSLAPELRAAVWAVDPDQPVSAVQTLEEHIQTELSGPRTVSIVLTAFSLSALLLAAIGIYGVMAHGVAQRKREIGIRMALGAASRDVVGTVTGQGMRLAAIGLLLGAPVAFGLTRAIRSAFFSVTGATPSMVLGVTGLLVLVAFVATYLPARRASRIEPVRALQTE